MVRTFHHHHSGMQKSKSFHFRRMFESGKHSHGLVDKDHDDAGESDRIYSKSLDSRSSFNHSMDFHFPYSDHSPAPSLGVEVPRMPPKKPTGIFDLPTLIQVKIVAGFQIAVKLI